MRTEGVLTTYAGAWLAGDVETVFGSYAPDIVLHYGGASPFAGDHVGRERAIEVLVETSVRSGRALLAVDAIYDQGDHGALFVREAVTVDGARVEVQRALRFRIAGGLLAECWLYDQDQHLVDRAWGVRPPAPRSPAG